VICDPRPDRLTGREIVHGNADVHITGDRLLYEEVLAGGGGGGERVVFDISRGGTADVPEEDASVRQGRQHPCRQRGCQSELWQIHKMQSESTMPRGKMLG
jgi:hypothetical protein